MQEKKMEGTLPVKRMVAAEQRATLELHAIIAQMKFIEDGVGPRIKRLRGAWACCTAAGAS